MSVTKTVVGKNADGSTKYDYDYTCDHGCPADTCTGGLLVTGPISGTVAFKDGTVYSVSDEVIEHAPGHAGLLVHHIERLHEKAGYNNGQFKHVCTDFCGAERDA